MTTLEQYDIPLEQEQVAPVIPAKSILKDLQGQRFGRWSVIGRSVNNSRGHAMWDCVCSCGVTRVVPGGDLRSGKSASCGRHEKGPKPKNLTGLRFGRLTVLSRSGNNSGGRVCWLCACACTRGKTHIVTAKSLLNGASTSCGCFAAEIRLAGIHTTHGQSNTKSHGCTRAYTSWYNLVQRATNPNNKQWTDYGGRGITVSEEYRDFSRFFADLGPRPIGMSIERINNEKGYEPGNLCYADRQTQVRNRRVRKDSATGCKGLGNVRNRYRVRICVDGKNIHLGYFASLEIAKAVRELAEFLYWGRV